MDSVGGKGCYFEGAVEVPGIAKCLGEAIHEMRMAGLGPDTVDPRTFIIRKKGKELLALLNASGRSLKETYKAR